MYRTTVLGDEEMVNMDYAPESPCRQIVVFQLGEERFGLWLSSVQRIIRAVQVTALPDAPAAILGVIDYRGEVIPVVDIRRRLQLPERPMQLSDRIIIADSPRRRLALIADSVSGVHDLSERELSSAFKQLPGALLIQNAITVNGDLVLICDLDQFLRIDEEQNLDACLGIASPGQSSNRMAGERK